MAGCVGGGRGGGRGGLGEGEVEEAGRPADSSRWRRMAAARVPRALTRLPDDGCCGTAWGWRAAADRDAETRIGQDALALCARRPRRCPHRNRIVDSLSKQDWGAAVQGLSSSNIMRASSARPAASTLSCSPGYSTAYSPSSVLRLTTIDAISEPTSTLAESTATTNPVRKVRARDV